MIHIQRVDAETGKTSEIITLDVTLDASLTHSMAITSFPVEDGADISDHAQKLPDSVTVRGLISSTPLRFVSFDPAISDARPRAAFEILAELQDSPELVRIVTDLKTYDNMGLMNLSAPRRQDTKHALMFTAMFQAVRIVASEIVQLPPEEAVQETATKKEEGGKVAPKPPDSPDKAEKASYAHHALYGN